MALLDSLERRFGRFAISHLTQLFCAIWVITWCAIYFHSNGQGLLEGLSLSPSHVLSGEWWRIFTFMVIPPAFFPLWLIIALMVFMLIGRSLEEHWGTFRYNLYILCGWFGSVLGSFFAFIGPVEGAYLIVMPNSFVFQTVFLAFATLFPNFIFHLYFVLPVKVKWLALIVCGLLIYQFFAGDWGIRGMLVLVMANYFMFFGAHLYRLVRGRQRRLQQHVADIREARTAFHTCAECGVTELDDPERTFRVCNECDPPLEYCDLHLKNHEHRRDG